MLRSDVSTLRIALIDLDHRKIISRSNSLIITIGHPLQSHGVFQYPHCCAAILNEWID
jgi:hypothetical protein